MATQTNGSDFGRYADAGHPRMFAAMPRPDVMKKALFPLMPGRSSVLFDDFTGDALNLDFWALLKDANGTDFAITAAANGTIAGTAGNTNGEGIGIKGAALWKGDLNCGMEVRMKLDVVTNSIFEVGFADASVTSHKDPVGDDIDTPTVTNNLTDGALIHRHTGQTLTNAALLTVGSTPYAAQKVTTGWAPTLDTFFTVRIQLDGDDAFAFIYDASYGLVADVSLTSAVEGGTLLSPFVNVTRVSTADKVATIDYIWCWQNRT